MTTSRRLTDPLKAYRIGDTKGIYPIFSAEGARHMGARWHKAGDSIIYASEHCATAMLEKLVRLGGKLPTRQHYIEITLPAGVSYEVVTPDQLPDWHEPNSATARAFGHDWYLEKRSLILIVPSVVARVERNILINADHPEFPTIRTGLVTPLWWDQRLFA